MALGDMISSKSGNSRARERENLRLTLGDLDGRVDREGSTDVLAGYVGVLARAVLNLAEVTDAR